MIFRPIVTEHVNFLHGAFLTPQKSEMIKFKQIWACKEGGKSKTCEGGVFLKQNGCHICFYECYDISFLNIYEETHPSSRIAKCHGYDGYIRVKVLAGWSKSLGEHAIWQYQDFLGKICTTNDKFMGIN